MFVGAASPPKTARQLDRRVGWSPSPCPPPQRGGGTHQYTPCAVSELVAHSPRRNCNHTEEKFAPPLRGSGPQGLRERCVRQNASIWHRRDTGKPPPPPQKRKRPTAKLPSSSQASFLRHQRSFQERKPAELRRSVCFWNTGYRIERNVGGSTDGSYVVTSGISGPSSGIVSVPQYF